MRSLRIYRKVLLILAGIIAVAGGSFWFWVKSVEHREWRAIEMRVAEWAKELEARRGARIPLRGTPTPGDAWKDYVRAITVLDKKEPLDLLDAFIDRKPEASLSRVQAILANQASALEYLRLGVRREEVQYPGLEAVDTDDPSLLPVFQAQELSRVAIAKAILLADEGRNREAAELLLDVCQFSQDIARLGSIHSEREGLDILVFALRQIRDIVTKVNLDAQTLQQIDRELALIERWPSLRSLVFLRELARTGADLINDSTLDNALRKRREAAANSVSLWRYGFSRRLFEARAYSRFEDWVREAIIAESGPWQAERTFYKKLRQEDRAGELWTTPRNAYPGEQRRVIAHLRLLRVAAQFRATGSIHLLDDPFGSKLKAKETGGVLRIWSIGRDATDHGGIGYWEPTDDRDILLEVKR